MDLSYFNSRVRGQMGRLLRAADYAPFMDLRGEERYAERLRATPYGPYLGVAAARYERTEEIVSSALTESLADSFAALRKAAPEGARRLLDALVSTWEAYNIKAIIRGLARGVKREDVQRTLIPAGGLDRAALDTLLGAKDVTDLLRFFETWGSPYARPIREGIREFLRNGSINAMEIKLDLFAYGSALKTLGNRSRAAGIIRDILVLRIDIRNIVTLINIAGQNYSEGAARELFIEGGGRLGKEAFMDLSGAKDRQGLLGGLARSVKDRSMAELISATGPDNITGLEERLDAMAEKRLRTLSVVEPLGIAVGAAYIHMKVREVKNLRLLDRAAAFGIPEDEVREMLIYPV